MAHHSRKISTGRRASGDDARGVEVELLGAGAEGPEGGFPGVVHCGGKWRFRGKSTAWQRKKAEEKEVHSDQTMKTGCRKRG